MSDRQDAIAAIEERRKKKGIKAPDDFVLPSVDANGKAAPIVPTKKRGETLGEAFDRNIKEQGGWGLSGETRRALGADNESIPEVLRPITDLTGNVADLGFRALQGLGAGVETGAEKADELAIDSGLADKLSYDGNKFLPGSAIMALGEAFPLGGAETGHVPTVPVQDLSRQANELLRAGKGRAELDRLMADNGHPAFGPDLDEVLAARDAGKPVSILEDTPDVDHVLKNPPTERIDYRDPQVPESVHPDDSTLVPPKGGLEAGRGMDEREFARDQKRRWNDKAEQDSTGQGELPLFEEAKAGKQDNSLDHLSDDDLLAMEPTLEVREEFRRRNREQFGQEPVRGGDHPEPETPIVPQTKKVGGIGAGQGVVPDDLAHFGVTKQAPRSREETIKAAEDVDFENDGRIGDVAAIAAKGAAETRMAAADVMDALNKHGPSSDEYLEAVTHFEKTASKHSENSSELGRGLNNLAKAGATKEEIAKFSELASDPKNADKFAKLVARHREDPDALRKIVRDGTNPTMRDRIFSWRYNLMLSGPKTHIYNIGGNTANIAVDLAEHGLAAIMGQGRKLAGNYDRVSGREFGARLMGAMAGAKQGLKNMPAAYREGRPLDDANRAEMLGGKIGNLQVPVKAIAAEDEFFRSVASVSNTYGMAVRTAIKEGLKGPELKARIEKLIQNPTEEMIKDTGEYSKRMRFQDDPSFIGKMLEGARTRKPGDGPLTALGKDTTTLIIPFVRTPDSLVRTALRRSPLGIIEGQNWADLKAGGARRDLATARIAMGSGVVAIVAAKVADGIITGEGPRDYKKREALELTGWQANSVKVGDKYYSYEGLEPLSILFGGTATTMERWKEGSTKGYVSQAGNQVFNAAEVLTNQSWAEGLNDVFDAISAPPGQREAKINDFFANMAQSFVVPAAVRQANQSYGDRVVRDTRGDDSLGDRVIGRIKTGIPGLSDDLPAQVDALGREKTRGDAIGPDILSRAYSPGVENTPEAAELKRLMDVDPDGKPVITSVPRSVSTKDFPIGRLTAQEHHDYQGVTGAYLTALMSEAMASPEWAKMSDDEKREEIKGMAADSRKWAREDVFVVEDDRKPEKEKPDVGKEESFDFGVPTNMRRSPAKNKAVGGVSNSDHLDGDAIDFVPAKGVTWKKLYAEAKRFFGPDAKVIHELPGYRNGVYHKEHVHVSLPGLNAPEM